jgi:hypothetical protein
MQAALKFVIGGAGGRDPIRYRDHPVAFAGQLVRRTSDGVVSVAGRVPGGAGREKGLRRAL